MTVDWSEARAHTDGPGGRRDFLRDHLSKVARLAGEFSSFFGGTEPAYLLGILHDLGKLTPEFQEYLARLEAGERLSHGPPHSIWGAALGYWLIYKRGSDEEAWKEPCLPIAGHHGGLRAAGDLALRLDEFVGLHELELRQMGVALGDAGLLPKHWRRSGLQASTSREFRIRMLLSALADADYLATEEHFKPEVSARRPGWPTIEALWGRFLVNQTELLERASRSPTVVNEVRRDVYESCVGAAEMAPGLFRLTVPTGGGKTRSGLAFALRHACRHGLGRVVVAVPYTSITDQTAREYRAIVGEDAVVEHHSQVKVGDAESEEPQAVRARLATENWAAPVIVTTTVQLFESMFGDRPGKVRKLHNLAGATIILDEVQTLPTGLLETTLDGLETLAREYGSSIMFSTATQPAFEAIPCLRDFGNLAVREIVPGYGAHFEVLRRVEYEVRKEPLGWNDLADEVREQRQVLVIVNTRRDAMALLDALGGERHVQHLSTLLCGSHRRRVLDGISRRLKMGIPVRAICTQVVEAGVDLDFPVVYRAIGPLDRIVQAAGRCNREGRLEGSGRVIIFQPREGGAPRGTYQKGMEQAKLLIEREGAAGLHEPAVYREYFEGLFSYEDLDAKKVQACRRDLDYPETARRYRFMDESVPAVVPYGEAEARLADWERGPSREKWQKLQPYVVNFFLWEAQRLESEGWLQPLGDGLYYWLGRYDRVRGVVADARDPSDLIQ